MKTVDFSKITGQEAFAFMLGAVAPRPIAFASTIDKDGNVNLSPYSFFNAFSVVPPILAFSPARRLRDGTSKQTLDNVIEVPEVVINMVNYSIVEQMSLSSTEYDKGVNEFIKSGLTEVKSEKVKPPRVLESPASFECKVIDIINFGDHGGAGSMVICEVLMAHFNDDIFDAKGSIDPRKLDAVARLGGDWYSRASGDSLFEIPKPIRNKGIGIDQIPERIRNSKVLTGNNLGRLGNIEKLPDTASVIAFSQDVTLKKLMETFDGDKELLEVSLHTFAQKLLEDGALESAWKVLLYDGF